MSNEPDRGANQNAGLRPPATSRAYESRRLSLQLEGVQYLFERGAVTPDTTLNQVRGR